MNRRTRLYLLLSITGLLMAISSILLSLANPYVTWAAVASVALVDKVLGGWSILPPPLSWAIVSFIVVALCRFAIFESHKVGQRDIRMSYLILAAFVLLLGPFLWAAVAAF